MAMVTRAKRRRLEEEEEEEEEERLDRISRLPDALLGDIVSLLPSMDGARTQVVSSRWRPLWRSAPLNLDLHNLSYRHRNRITVGEISRILSVHPGPGRRFSIPLYNFGGAAANLDGWLRSPALDNLEELEFDYGRPDPRSPLPSSVHRFSRTLRVASFCGCGFPDGNNASALLHLPLLKQLSLSYVTISESSLHALLAGCPVLESLLLVHNDGCSRVRIVSPTLRSIGVTSGSNDLELQQLIIEDAPCLERLLSFGSNEMNISVISAPKLDILGRLYDCFPRLQLGTTVFQGSHIASLTTMVSSVKVLALRNMNLSLDVVINFIKCFPCLEKLHIETAMAGDTNVWCRKYRNVIGTLDLRMKKVVLTNYRGNKSHVNFAKFFILNARVLESMRFEVEDDSSTWIERQRMLLQIKNRASRGARFDFVSHNSLPGPIRLSRAEQTHNLTADPFVRFRGWA